MGSWECLGPHFVGCWMTVEQGIELIEIAHACRWLLAAGVLAMSIHGGLTLWRLIVLAKNQKHLW
jgi:hypothetical protein